MKRPYTVITKEIINCKGNGKLSDIYIYACCYNTIKHTTGNSHYMLKTISDKFKIPNRTLTDSLNRLSKGENNFLDKTLKTYYNDGSFSKKSKLYFNNNPEHFFFIYDDYFKLNIDRKTKGFILLLKAICVNNTNTYFVKKPIKGGINKTELANIMGITPKTLNTQLDLAIELNLIDIVENKIFIINECFPLRVSENNRYTEIVNTIQDICVKYNAEIPVFKNNDIGKVMIYYPLLESEIEKINDTKFAEYNSLKYVLEKRIRALPKTFSIEYIFKILGVKYKAIKEPIRRKPILIV